MESSDDGAESRGAENEKEKDVSDDTRASIITQKLRRGQELSAEELKYLKEKDPDLYTKAKQA